MSSINKIKTNDITYDVEDTSKQGLLIAGDNITIENNVISAQNSYVLPVASTEVLGGVKIGENLSIDSLGKVSSKNFNIILKNVSGLTPILVQSGDKYYNPDTNKIYTYVANAWDSGVEPTKGINYINTEDNRIYLYNGITLKLPVDPYTLPVADAVTLGGVKVGSNLSISSGGVLNATDTTYTAGDNINISNENVISAPNSVGQVATLPIASADLLGKILQYVGATDQNYTNGYFYKCVSDGAVDPTYSWENINIQDIPSGVALTIIDVANDTEAQVKAKLQSYYANYLLGKEYEIYLKNLKWGHGCTVVPYSVTTSGNSTTIDFEGNFDLTYYNSATENYGVYYRPLLKGSLTLVLDDGVVSTYNTGSGTVGYLPYYLNQILGMDNMSSYTPTGQYNPATKKYVDDNTVKRASLPTASSSNLGVIYQYVGTTDQNYTQGYFYQCVSDGGNPATYSWERVDVQPAGAGSTPSVVHLGNVNKYNTAAKALDINSLEKNTIYMLESFQDTWFGGADTQKYIYVKVAYNNTTYTKQLSFDIDGVSQYSTKYFPIYIYRNNEDIPQTISSGEVFVATLVYTVVSNDTGTSGLYTCGNMIRLWPDKIVDGYGGIHSFVPVQLKFDQTITGKKTFSTLPESSVNPTTADQLTRKDYVDKYSVKKVTTMPTASSTYEDEVYHYIGTTDQNYTKGYFYNCVNSGGTYSWVQMDVQPSGGAGSDPGVPLYWIYDNGTSWQSMKVDQKPAITATINYALAHSGNLPETRMSISGWPKLTAITYENGGTYVSALLNFTGYCRRFRSDMNDGWYTVYNGTNFTVYLDPTEYANGVLTTVYWDTTLNPADAGNKSWSYNGSSGFQVYSGPGANLAQFNQIIFPTDSLGTASSSNVGRYYMYTGTTSGSFTCGHIYRSVLSGNSYVWEEMKQASDSYELFIYDGATTSANATIIQKYYSNIKSGKPSVLLLVTDKYPGPDGSSITSPSGKMIIPMTLDTTNPWSSTNRACLLGVGVSYDATGVYHAKQVLQFSSDTVTGLYNLTWKLPEGSGAMTSTELFIRSGLSSYSNLSTYAVGDYVYYSSQIYRCTTAITTAEDFNANHWTQVNYLDYMTDAISANALNRSY